MQKRRTHILYDRQQCKIPIYNNHTSNTSRKEDKTKGPMEKRLLSNDEEEKNFFLFLRPGDSDFSNNEHTT